jgi:hypothetical protein
MCLEVIWIEPARASFESRLKVIPRRLATFKRRRWTSDVRPRQASAKV